MITRSEAERRWIIGRLWSYLTYRMGVRLITGEPPVADERDGSRAVAATANRRLILDPPTR